MFHLFHELILESEFPQLLHWTYPDLIVSRRSLVPSCPGPHNIQFISQPHLERNLDISSIIESEEILYATIFTGNVFKVVYHAEFHHPLMQYFDRVCID